MPALGVFHHLLAHAGLVDLALHEPPARDQAVHDHVLFLKGDPALCPAVSHPEHVADQLEAMDHGEISATRHVATEVVEAAAVQLRPPGIRVLAGRQRRRIQPGAGAGLGDAVQLLLCVVAISVADILDPGGLAELERPALDLGGQGDPLIEAQLDRIVEGDRQRLALAAPRADVIQEEVEGVRGPVVRRDHHHLAAPHQERQGGLDHLGQILVERRLVDDDQTLLSPQRPGHRRQGHDLEA